MLKVQSIKPEHLEMPLEELLTSLYKTPTGIDELSMILGAVSRCGISFVKDVVHGIYLIQVDIPEIGTVMINPNKKSDYLDFSFDDYEDLFNTPLNALAEKVLRMVLEIKDNADVSINSMKSDAGIVLYN